MLLKSFKVRYRVILVKITFLTTNHHFCTDGPAVVIMLFWKVKENMSEMQKKKYSGDIYKEARKYAKNN